MSVVPRRHCCAKAGTGLPLQLPASRVTGAPILPVPESFGWVTTAGGTPFTLALKLREALPPEFVAVTVTMVAARRVAVGMPTTPVAASTVAPAPLTA